MQLYESGCSQVTAAPKALSFVILPVLQLDCDQLITKQENDPVLHEVLCWVKEGLRPDYTAITHLGLELKSFHSQWAHLLLHNISLHRITIIVFVISIHR